MRNISLILNGVLLIAVGFLYYLHFKGNGERAVEATPQVVSGSGIVFVNSDSLLEEYTYYKNKREEFNKSESSIKAELKSESDKLQQEVIKYQNEAPMMTDQQRAQREEELGMKQQKLVQRKDELLRRLDEEQSKSSEELYTKLNEYLSKYNKTKNYHFVLGYQKGGGILFANDSLDITREVVNGLNKEFEEKKEK